MYPGSMCPVYSTTNLAIRSAVRVRAATKT